MWEAIRQAISSCFASTTFKKNYVDGDQGDRDAGIDTRARELKDRAIQLHLDKLEEKYLCCVCGTSGEARESDEHIYDTFSTVTLPSPEVVTAAVAAADGPTQRDADQTQADATKVTAAEVEPFEIEHLMYKIRHAVLKKEARTKRQAVAIHRDKGLQMIEEEEIETFSSFFKRPVKGYLCEACHNSAKTRLEMLTRQIETILFKANHPLLRKTTRHELQLLAASGQISQDLLVHILGVRSAAFELQDRASGQSPVSATNLESGTGSPSSIQFPQFQRKSASLPDSVIFSLRENAKCGICENRQSCFFIRQSVLFLCQFCCARDRFYRDNAICINDEPLTLEVFHLLMSLSRHYEMVHQENALRQLPQGLLKTAPTSLFGPHQEESLFRVQDKHAFAQQPPSGGGDAVQRIPVVVPNESTIPLPEQVDGSAVSLFHESRPSMFTAPSTTQCSIPVSTEDLLVSLFADPVPPPGEITSGEPSAWDAKDAPSSFHWQEDPAVLAVPSSDPATTSALPNEEDPVPTEITSGEPSAWDAKDAPSSFHWQEDPAVLAVPSSDPATTGALPNEEDPVPTEITSGEPSAWDAKDAPSSFHWQEDPAVLAVPSSDPATTSALPNEEDPVPTEITSGEPSAWDAKDAPSSFHWQEDPAVLAVPSSDPATTGALPNEEDPVPTEITSGEPSAWDAKDAPSSFHWQEDPAVLAVPSSDPATTGALPNEKRESQGAHFRNILVSEATFWLGEYFSEYQIYIYIFLCCVCVLYCLAFVSLCFFYAYQQVPKSVNIHPSLGYHKVHVNPTPSSIVEASSEPQSPFGAVPFQVSPKVVDSLAMHAGTVSTIPGVNQLFLNLATVVLSRRSKDPEQLLMDYLTNRRLPELQTLPHHRASSSNLTDHAPIDDTADFQAEDIGVDGENHMKPKDNSVPLDERLASCGSTPMHRAVLTSVARLLLSVRPHDVKDFLVTRWEGEAFGAEDAISVEASSPPHANSTAELLESYVPVGTVGRVVAKGVAQILLSKKPSNPLNFLTVHLTSRLGLSLGRTNDNFAVENMVGANGVAAASYSDPAMPQKSALSSFRRRNEKGADKTSSNYSTHSNASDSARRIPTFVTPSIGVQPRSHSTVGFSPMKCVKEENRTESFRSAGSRVGLQLSASQPKHDYDEDPLIEVSSAMRRSILKSPQPPLSMMEVAGGSLRDSLQLNMETTGMANAVDRGQPQKHSPPHFSAQQFQHMFCHSRDEDSVEGEEFGPSSAAAAFSSLQRELGIFQAKREFRLELLRDEVDNLRVEKDYREMVMRKRPSEEAASALGHVTAALEDAEIFLSNYDYSDENILLDTKFQFNILLHRLLIPKEDRIVVLFTFLHLPSLFVFYSFQLIHYHLGKKGCTISPPVDRLSSIMKLLGLLVLKPLSYSAVEENPGEARESVICSSAIDVSSVGYFQRNAAREFIFFLSRTVAKRVSGGTKSQIIQNGNAIFAQSTIDGLVFIAVTDIEYNWRVAFSLLGDLIPLFQQTFRGKYDSVTASTPDNFLPWKHLDEMLVKYQNPEEEDKILRLKKDIDETKILMYTAIEDLLERGQKIDDLVTQSEDLSYASKTFYTQAKQTNAGCCIVM
eukprot:gene5282-3787_t